MRMRKGILIRNLILTATLALFQAGYLSAAPFDNPIISIIIDDIGYRYHDDLAAINLPGQISYAVMPHSPHSEKISKLIAASGRDVILHLPMEAIEDKNNRYLGPGALKLDMDKMKFITTLTASIESIPNIIGVNNHMGSLLTMHTGRMEWLMDYLSTNNIFYVDSVTNRLSVAGSVAKKMNLPYIKRDVFLDNTKEIDYITTQFDDLIKKAKRKGKAVAIGHPHPQTITALSRILPELDRYGVKLISISEMVQRQDRNLIKASYD